MPRLRITIDDEQLEDEQLRERLSFLASDDDAMKLVKAIFRLLECGDLGFWLSPRLMRKLKAFVAKQQGGSRQGIGEVDDTVFLAWLEQGGSMEPNLRWEVESLPNNGGIYRILLQGGQNEKGSHNNSGQ